MTVGGWHRTERPDRDATALRPAVTIAWAADRDSDSCDLWLDLYESSAGRQGVVVPIGRLDRVGLERLERALEQARNYQACRITVDLSRVHHLDYRGVGRFAAQMERSLAEGCEVRIEGVTRYLREIIRAAGVVLTVRSESGVGAACGTAPQPANRRTSALRVRTGAGSGFAAGPGGAA